MMYEKRIERIQRVLYTQMEASKLSGRMLGFGIWLLGYRARPNLRIACLDVGQGDGIVLEIEGTWNLLIDGRKQQQKCCGTVSDPALSEKQGHIQAGWDFYFPYRWRPYQWYRGNS